jgi:seryl-tRNA synthetase
MLNLKFIQENPEFVIDRLAVKQFDARSIVEGVVALYKRRNEVQIEIDALKAGMNKLSKKSDNCLRRRLQANSAKKNF